MSLRKDQVVENFHGVEVKDPFRWLEDSSLPDTIRWIEQQNQKCTEYYQSLPRKKDLEQRIKEIWDYSKFGVPQKAGDYYYYLKQSGLQNQPVLYRQTGLNHEDSIEVVIDPNTFSDTGTVALIDYTFSENGRYMAYRKSESGSDWQEIRIRDLNSRQDFPKILQRVKFTAITWTHDDKGFFYNRFPEEGSVPPEDQSNYNRVYYHQLGTDQKVDPLIYEDPENKEFGFSPRVMEDGEYLVLYVYHGTSSKNRIYVKRVEDSSFVKLLDDGDAKYERVGNDGSVFYFLTDNGAPHGKVIAIDLNEPNKEHWRDVIPEQEPVIDQVKIVGNHFLVLFKEKAQHKLKVYTMDGRFDHEVILPAIGTVTEIQGKGSETTFFFGLTSFLFPTQVYSYDLEQKNILPVFETKMQVNIDEYETKQVFYPSKDDTQISMFITSKKGLELNDEHATLLYGYGGFNISLTPSFSPSILAWLEMRGIYAVANLRGGSEYGEEWHRSGMLENKQNVFDDFISAGEWLTEQGYTNPSKLAIYGRSNGGLLVAATMVQRPDLFGAVICGVPVIDMLRYHKFTIGRYWIPEYGNAEENIEHFRFMYAYSPLHNVKKDTNYPSILILTADTDDRVVPAHAFKFTATLQESNPNHQIILRLEIQAGHGLGKPTAKVIEEQADMYAFLSDRLKMS